MDLFDAQRKRLYLTEGERAAFLAAAKNAALPVRTFCLVPHYTGCRISEARAPASFDFSGKAIVFETLQERHRGVYRPFRSPGWIPVP